MYAQGKVSLRGTLIDKEVNEPIIGASVRVLSLPDSTYVTGMATDTLGAFLFSNLKKAHYVLKISYIGYTTKLVDADLKAHKERKVDLGFITMTSDAVTMKEAEVVANAKKIQVQGDSVVFSSAAYHVPEGSTLEALVKLLPGAKIDSEGNITINGKTVNKILVDGKEFFLNDKEVALKNIPTEMIESIKTYDRKSDMTRVTGIDDGNEETVLDLGVKKEMKNGWFGNLNAGGGTKERYENRGIVNRFTDKANLSLIGNAKNTQDAWRWWDKDGLKKNNELGANFNTTAKKLDTEGNVRYQYEGRNIMKESSSQNYVAERGAFEEGITRNLSSQYTLSANGKVEWKPDTMTNILFRPNLSYTRGRTFAESNSGSYDTDPYAIADNILDYNDEISQISKDPTRQPSGSVAEQLMGIVVNTNDSRSQSYSTNANANGELQLNRKISDNGRNLTLRFTGGYGEGRSKQLSAADITYNTLGTNQQNNRYYRTPSVNYNYSAQFSYSEPIADRTYLQASYQYSYSYSKNDRRAFVYDSQAYRDLTQSLLSYRYDIDAILRFMEEAEYQMRDTVALSQFSEYRNYIHTAGLQFQRVREAYNFNVGVDALPQHTTLNYKYMGKEYPEVRRNVFNLSPHTQLRWNFNKHTNLFLRYRGSSNQPSMTNLLDITDDSNPLNISKGNPGLKPSFTHNVHGNFNTNNVEREGSIYAYTHFRTTRNSISNKTTYDKVTGVRTTMPMNINGNWNGGAGFGFNRAFGHEKAFNVGSDLGAWYSHNVGFYNNTDASQDDQTDIKSITRDLSTYGKVRISYRNKWINVELSTGDEFSHAKNNVNTQATPDTHNYNYGADVEWTMPWGTKLSTDIHMDSRRGYTQDEMNTDELLWNAQLSHSFLRGKALTLSVEMKDILGQQTNISRSISAFMQSEYRSNAIYQYAMLHAIYRFSIFGGKNVMGTDKERK